MNINPDQPYLKELEQVDFQPVFILGLHRSGTSILYKMLTATGCFNPVTAYHLIKYEELLLNHHRKREEHAKHELTESLREKGLEDRGIDRLKVTADFAEEYGFLLSTKTVQMSLTPQNIVLFQEMCKKIQCIAENEKPILLKNPFDFPNFLYIKQVFPNARFVFIHRYPFKTISSTLKAMTVLLKKKNPYTIQLSEFYNKLFRIPVLLHFFRFFFSKIPEVGVFFIASSSAKATNYYVKNIEKLPKDDYISITYEEFCSHPQKTIEDIMNALSLTMINTVDAGSLMDPRKVDIDPSVRRLRRFIYLRMKRYCEMFGYLVEEE
jgi:hypothetical protein